MAGRKYFCPNDLTEVADIDSTCPKCGYGAETSYHQRDWLTAEQKKEREQSEQQVQEAQETTPLQEEAK